MDYFTPFFVQDEDGKECAWYFLRLSAISRGRAEGKIAEPDELLPQIQERIQEEHRGLSIKFENVYESMDQFTPPNIPFFGIIELP